MMQRELNYAIIDEVDSILIDEARTPLIISGRGDKSTDMYKHADGFVSTLKVEDDFTDRRKRQADRSHRRRCREVRKIFRRGELRLIRKTWK